MNILVAQSGRRDRQGAAVPGGESESKLHYQQDAAVYIAALLSELRNLSGMAELDKLTRALDAAYYEAYAVAEHHRKSRAKSGEEQRGGF